MPLNPFLITKAEGFNHSYEQLALLMHFKKGVADVLLSNDNVFIEGSRGSGKSMYLRLLSAPVMARYKDLSSEGRVDQLPDHTPFFGAYIKLDPTIFGSHEYEGESHFTEVFQHLFNVYCGEAIVLTILEAANNGLLNIDSASCSKAIRRIHRLICEEGSARPTNIQTLYDALRSERRTVRQQLNELPYSPDSRSQPSIVWELCEDMTEIDELSGMRIHLLLDEYDNLSDQQQRAINSYLRIREKPIAFKIACKKHRLILVDLQENPLNPSGDFSRIELDDDNFGIDSEFSDYLEGIANKRLANAGFKIQVKELLGLPPAKSKPKAERRYHGFSNAAMLSSGVVRTFIELCRDIYSICESDDSGEPKPALPLKQDRVIKEHAARKWSALGRDRSARPELQHMVNQIAALFAEKSKGKEKQVIRLEILDFDHVSKFVKQLIHQALEYEALVQPNRERLQKNAARLSRGYLLHRLLCVHFRLEPQSRWDAEIRPEQLERLVLGGEDVVREVAARPTARAPVESASRQLNFKICPVLNQQCPQALTPTEGLGFLSCRLPQHGKIRDAIQLLKSSVNHELDGIQYSLKTAEDYPSSGDIACKVCAAMTCSSFVLVELSRLSQSVAMELGLAIARRKPTFVLFNREEQRSVPDPFSSLEYFAYSITPESVEELTTQKIIPSLRAKGGGVMKLGPQKGQVSVQTGTFLAFPNTEYYQKLVVPKLTEWLETRGLGPVTTERDGQSLQEIDRAAQGIARSTYCLIDTTQGTTTRAMYLGMAQGYRRKFANLVDVENDPSGQMFANGRSKSEIQYRDCTELIDKLSAGMFKKL